MLRLKQAIRRQGPALVLATVALMAALGGGVYAAAKIDGRTIRVKSLPGNRLKPRSVAADRLRPGVLAALGGTVTGARIDERSLGQVPSADYADSAGVAATAKEAETALEAINAIDSDTVSGHTAGCQPAEELFAGACWQMSGSGPATAPVAAAACAASGGALPEALELAAFAQHPGVSLGGEEWSGDLTNFSGPNAYGVLTVSTDSTINLALSTATKPYRCVIPLVV
jgi:hypothetical protein